MHGVLPQHLTFTNCEPLFPCTQAASLPLLHLHPSSSCAFRCTQQQQRQAAAADVAAFRGAGRDMPARRRARACHGRCTSMAGCDHAPPFALHRHTTAHAACLQIHVLRCTSDSVANPTVPTVNFGALPCPFSHFAIKSPHTLSLSCSFEKWFA